MTTYYTFIESPVGPIMLMSDGTALTGLFMNQHRHGPDGPGEEWKEEIVPVLTEAKKQLTEYFAGERQAFDLPVTATEGTPFQRRVWDELSRIGYGETISYGELAKRIGDPKAVRAVGLANGRNPISIIVPCHRVIGANGKLTGYGGGLDRKATLIAPRKQGTRAGERLALLV